MIKRKDSIFALLITGVVAFLYISGIPSAFFVDIQFFDVDPICIILFINIIITMIVGLFLHRIFTSNIILGYKVEGLKSGIKKYGLSCLIIFVVSTASFALGLLPFDNKPTVYKILFDGIIYYIGVGVIEEFFCRGLLLNAIEGLFQRHKTHELIAVILSAAVFGLGHIIGMLGQPLLLIISKVVWTIGLGIYLGAVYKKTNNLWLVSIFHVLIDFCGLPFCFSSTTTFPAISSFLIILTFSASGIYGIYLLKKTHSYDF